MTTRPIATGGDPRLLVIIGSTREGRQAPTVAAWLARRVARRPHITVATADLRDLNLRNDLADSPGRIALASSVDHADMIVVVTPEYNHSFPGPLKTAFDSVRVEWQAKPIGFVSYGGVGGGVRAVEVLRLVVAELHMVSVRTAVSIHGVADAFSGSELREAEIVESATDEMLDQLCWWASALTPTREKRPYPA